MSSPDKEHPRSDTGGGKAHPRADSDEQGLEKVEDVTQDATSSTTEMSLGSHLRTRQRPWTVSGDTPPPTPASILLRREGEIPASVANWVRESASSRRLRVTSEARISTLYFGLVCISRNLSIQAWSVQHLSKKRLDFFPFSD